MPRPEIADPEDFGRKLSDQPPVPEAVVELRICRCKMGCENMLCKCRENNLRLAFVMDVVTEKTIMMIFTNYDGTTDDKGFAAAEYNSYKLLFLNQNRT